MTEKPYCDLGIFIMADKAILPTDARTPSRWHVAIEPVEVFDYHNRSEFIEVCKRAISRGMPEIAMPAESEMYWDDQGPAMKQPVVLKYAGISTWDELEKKSIYVTIECYQRGFLIESWGHTSDGKWSDEKLLELRMPSDVGLEVVVDAVLDHLKNRRDLPGLNISPFRSQTAKGA